VPRILIAGCGFLGGAAADLFYGAGWDVLGLTASSDSAAALGRRPYEIIAADITDRRALDCIRSERGGCDAVVHCASSGRGGAESYRAVYLEGLRNLTAAFPGARCLFTGSTSVYARTDGGVVDENSEAAPDRETGKILLEAEAVALAAGGFVARLAGIYGPGRSAYLRRFLDGTAAIDSGGERWINQIHRDDAAGAILHLLTAPAAPGIYNVADDRPATQREIYGWLAEYFGKPLPPCAEPDAGRKRGWTSKRVSNAKLRASGWAPRHPDYRSALPALAAGPA
jgi:nucleoside-diphosphate-sugar epimerase